MAKSDKSRDEKRTGASAEERFLRASREASLGASARKFDPTTVVPPSAKPDAWADSERELTHDARFRGEDNG